MQRCPAYRVAVVDRGHARLFRIAGEETETVTAPAAASVRGTGFGWYGLETYRVQQRAARLAGHHYHDTAALLAKAMAQGEPELGNGGAAVPDVIEEMVTRTLQDGGQVCPVHDGLSRIAARLRFPVAQ